MRPGQARLGRDGAEARGAVGRRAGVPEMGGGVRGVCDEKLPAHSARPPHPVQGHFPFSGAARGGVGLTGGVRLSWRGVGDGDGRGHLWLSELQRPEETPCGVAWEGGRAGTANSARCLLQAPSKQTVSPHRPWWR